MSKEILPEKNYKSVCSVTDLAKQLSLSRSRFYQLQKQGIFPASLRDQRTGRPFFDDQLQKTCIEVRKTGVGVNGQCILFYNPRTRPNNKYTRKIAQENNRHSDITSALNQMGLSVSTTDVSKAIISLYPQGLPKEKDQGTVIRELFRYFKQMS